MEAVEADLMEEFRSPVKTFFKALALAVVCSAIGFFTGNFLAISVLMLYSTVKHVTPDYTIAYRYVGLTCAGLGFLTGIGLGWFWDIRKAREQWERDAARAGRK